MSVVGVALTATLSLLAGSSAGQEVASVPAGADTHVSEEYRLGPGDLLTIRIVGVGKYERIRVSNSGKIHVPNLGVLRVYGSTMAELETAVAQGLRQKGLINEPWVQVNVVEPQSKPVYILGEVIIPGQFVIVDEMHVLDLVVLGGGFNEMATPVAYLYRRSPVYPDKTPSAQSYNSTEWSDEVIRIDFERIASGKDPDVKLQAGDVLYVPERKKLAFYVAGEVAHPGAFQYPQTGSNRMSQVSSIAVSDRPLRLSEAVAKSGGPLRTAKKSKCVLVRFDRAGVSHETPFDLTEVLGGLQPDILVEPNDIIFVPGSTAKSLGYSMVKILPTILITGLLF